MRKLSLALLLVPSLSSAAVFEDAFSGAWKSFNAAMPQARVFAAADPIADANRALYLLAHRGNQVEKKLAELNTGVENIALLTDYLAGTEYGPKQIPEHLRSFSEEIAARTKDFNELAAGAAAASAKVRGGNGSAAQAFANQVLTLRAQTEGLESFAAKLAAEVKKAEAKLGFESVYLSRELVSEAKALKDLSDILVAASEEISSKAKGS